MDDDVKRALLGSKLRVRAKSPFFSVLINHLKVKQTNAIPTAATDGKNLLINGEAFLSWPPDERDFTLVHEVLHAALGHCWRSCGKEHQRANLACDYVVNLICQEAGYHPTPRDPLNHAYKKMTMEEVYALLPPALPFLGGRPGDVLPEGNSAEAKRSAAEWRRAIAQAAAVEKMYGKGSLGNILAFQEEQSSINWQAALWTMFEDNFDFNDWDQRLVYSGLFVENLVEELSVGVSAVCIDTSGSTHSILGKFIGEVKAIAEMTTKSIPLYFDDYQALVGPLDMSEIDRPVGGGGTSFVEFFREADEKEYARVIYLTDLQGSFPNSTTAETLWVVPPGCTIIPPFGRVVKILE